MRDTSRYQVDGVRVPSVTEVLQIEGIVDFSFVPPDVLEAARRRGNDVHRHLELRQKGLLLGDDIDPLLQPYIDAYERFERENCFEVYDVEQVVVDHTWRYAGTYDLRGTLSGVSCVIDLKTSVTLGAGGGLQLAGYARCIVGCAERYALQLLPRGEYRLQQATSTSDEGDFLAAVRMAHFKLEHGIAGLPS